jgi:hypothetical protein
LHFVPAGEDRPRRALEVARAWCRGDASLDDVRSAEAAAENAALSTADPTTAAFFAVTATTYVCDVATTPDAATASAKAAGGPFKAGWANALAIVGANGTPEAPTFLSFAPLVERWIPLPVVLLSLLGYPNAIPFNLSMVAVGPRD